MGTIKKYHYDVDIISSGQVTPYSNYNYVYHVTSDRPFDEVKKFCMNILHVSFDNKKKSCGSHPELVNFTRITDNNMDRDFSDELETDVYLYHVRLSYGG